MNNTTQNDRSLQRRAVVAALLPVVCLMTVGGCHINHLHHKKADFPVASVRSDAPRELSKVVLPTYRIEPPDILSIEAVRLVPSSPYKLNTVDIVRLRVERTGLDRVARGDGLSIRVVGAPTVAPIDGVFTVQTNGQVALGPPYGLVNVAGLTIEEAEQAIETHLAKSLTAPDALVSVAEVGTPLDAELPIDIDGTIDLGAPYGAVRIVGMTTAEAEEALTEHLKAFFTEPTVSLNLIQTSFQQQVAGEHLVNPDGTVRLGAYDSVRVVGLTLDEAEEAIEQQLSEYLDEPEVAVSIFAFNSKMYYIITEGAGFGDRVFQFPITGNDTVLGALAQINGLSEVSSSKMWIARPSPEAGDYQILPIKWNEIASLGGTTTNFQLMPGDRLYVAEDKLVAMERSITKFTAPFERIMGFSILGVETVTRFSGAVLKGGGNPRGRGVF